MHSNQFKKYELVILKCLTLQHVNQFRQNSDCIELMHKIQSMIDNYCEHDWNEIGSEREYFRCSKCGEES
jgi:hypothetical protein